MSDREKFSKHTECFHNYHTSTEKLDKCQKP